jgi:SAM-dependent methyltransferase
MTHGADAVREVVRRKYGEAAGRVSSGEGLPADCCSSSGCCGGSAAASCDPITSNLYDAGDLAGVPEQAVRASLGCGNPTALAELREGEVVLDLGSGGGIDVLLSARRVGPTGKAYGLDMTDEMLALANENKRKAGATNVEFLKGEIENVPLPDESVDVVISNCVVNLSGDKRRVIQEAFRVLKPGGRFAVSDVVVRGYVPEAVRESVELWIGCVAGALEEQQFLGLLREAGFENPSIEVTRVYDAADAATFLRSAGLDPEAIAPQIAGRLVSAFVRGTKPAAPRPTETSEPAQTAKPNAARSCCGPECCSSAA